MYSAPKLTDENNVIVVTQVTNVPKMTVINVTIGIRTDVTKLERGNRIND